MAALRALHYKSQTVEGEAKLRQMGLDLVEGKVRNNVEAGVLEPAMSKIKMIQVRSRRCGGSAGWLRQDWVAGWVMIRLGPVDRRL